VYIDPQIKPEVAQQHQPRDPTLAALVRQAEAEVAPAASEEAPLYAPRRKIYPQSVRGTFRTVKWVVLVVTLAIYYLLPFVRWDRGPGAPSQAVLVDFPNRRFYFFFIEIWPQEVYYITGLLIIAAMALFLMNAIAGRVWCGYLCPQTVWTDLFQAVERLVEGDRREHYRRDQQPWTLDRLARAGIKHFLWLMIAWWTGGAWVLYFADAPTLVRDLATFQAPVIAYLWIGILTATTYVLAGHMREQVCTYMCPWPRIQAALTDEYALNVTYRYDRGEPRCSVKTAALLRAKGEPAGDCIDCRQCVYVCPTGVDIRDGPNLGCIQCGLCIDACDAVMAKINRPPRLIAYDNDINIRRRLAGEQTFVRIIRPRTLLYAAVILVTGAVMLYSLATRASLAVNVLHDRNPVYVVLSDGGIRNAYTMRVLNMRHQLRRLELEVEAATGRFVEVVGAVKAADGRPLLEVGPDQTREFRVLVTQYGGLARPALPITFTLHDPASGESATAADYFRGPKVP
jgi:cytochrome c oxidase accessory protein FixG